MDIKDNLHKIESSNDRSSGKTTAPSRDDSPLLVVPYYMLFSGANHLDRFLVLLGLVGAVGQGVLLPLYSILFGNFANIFGGFDLHHATPAARRQFEDDVASLSLKFLYLGLGAAAAGCLQMGCLIWSGSRQCNRLRQRYLFSALRQDITYFDVHTDTGSLLHGLTEDVNAVQTAISEKLGVFLQHMTTFLVGYIIAFTRGWDLTLVMIGCLPFLAGTGWWMAQFTTVFTAKADKVYSEANGIVQQAISQVRTVMAYNQEEEVIAKYKNALKLPEKLGVRQSGYGGLSQGALQFIVMCSYGLTLFYGAHRVAAGAYSGGRVLNVIIAALVGGFSLGQATPNIQYFAVGRVAGYKLFDLIKRRPVIGADDEGEVPDQLKGNLELCNVRFAYPVKPEVLVLDGLNLVIPQGKTVALVGESGSGKSTIVGLIERFYDPLEGVVLVDGKDLRTINLKWYRNQVALVSQEPILFATSIIDNILQGREGASKEEVWEAAKAANAHEFITKLPLGYDTHVGERGLQLSGGQKQRIAIARAILRRPQIMLLDEATSALDVTSERAVQQALDQLVAGRTTVVVAHRLSTVKNADVIAVMRKGSIVEQGRHEDLVQDPSGVYLSLIKLQLQRAAQEAEGEDGEPDDPVTPSVSAKHDAICEVLRCEDTRVVSPPEIEDSGRVGMKETKVQDPGEGTCHAPSDGGSPKTKIPLHRLVVFNKPEWPLALVGCLASAGRGAVQPSFAFIFSEVLSMYYEYTGKKLKSKASFYAWMFLVVACGSLLFTFFQQFCFGVMGQKLATRMRVLLLGAIFRQEVGWFDLEENSSGALSSKLSSDATHIRGAVGDVFGLVFQNLTTLALGYLIALVYNWRVALLITGIAPLILVAGMLNMRRSRGITSSVDTVYAGANQSVTDALTSIRVVQAYNLQEYISRMYGDTLAAATLAMRRSALVQGSAAGFSQFTMFSMYAIVLWFGGMDMREGRSDFNEFLKAFFAVLFAAMGLAQASVGFPDLGKAQSAIQHVFPIVDRKPCIDSSTEEGWQEDKLEGALELKHVKFTYPSRPSIVIFSDFSLKIPTGRTVALVGESGSGKSTIVGLIERFYDPLEGVVLVDGKDLRTINLKWYRNQIGLVSQEPLLFNGTIFDNIRYGNMGSTMKEVESAAKVAQADDFIREQPDGYLTVIGDRGVQLSGGQKQRVAIARAVVRDPRILLLDEATSALDAHAEKEVQEALDRVMVGRTSVVIAHRLSTVRTADVIAVVYRGALLEQGSHEELMALPGGGYRRLMAAQMKERNGHGVPGGGL